MKSILILIAAICLVNCSNDKKTNMANDEQELNKLLSRDSAKAFQDPLFRLDKDSVKKVYGDRFIGLRAIINKHDPIGLIANGAPDDEYEAEVKTILVQLDNNKANEQQVQELIYREFLRWFGDESTIGHKDSYKAMAKDIYNWTDKTTIR